MHGHQGERCAPEFVDHVRQLLLTDLPIPLIAERLDCARSLIVAINRKYQIREYRGKRATWTLRS